MAVSLDFLSAQFTKVLEELRHIKLTLVRLVSDNLANQVFITLSRFEAGWQVGIQEMTERVDAVELQVKELVQKVDSMDQRHVTALSIISDKLDRVLGRLER